MNKLRILTANIAFGIPKMDKLSVNLRTHRAFHSWKVIPFILTKNYFNWLLDYSSKLNPERIKFFQKHSNLNQLIKMIENEKIDVVVLNELILQAHEEIIISALRSLGFSYFKWGLSDHHADATVATLIASRFPILSESLDLVVPQSKQMGGGGGAVSITLKDFPITFIGCHLANGLKPLFDKQIKVLVEFTSNEQKKYRSVVMAGDFNAGNAIIQATEKFSTLNLKTVTNQDTCPLCLPKNLRMVCDHIFVSQNWRIKTTSYLPFGSDHLAVSTEVEF